MRIGIGLVVFIVVNFRVSLVFGFTLIFISDGWVLVIEFEVLDLCFFKFLGRFYYM